LEQTYSHIRVRGELSGLKLAASGHLYGDIKDVDANVNIVCWRGTMNKLKIRPEEGMDVIITGRVSSYAKSSRYQIIIESLELAGEGALLKMLEERRKKLAAEGLFDENLKKPLPFLPKTIGVVTSPTGAVIRDIMHRLKDRFPRHALVWPVNVQGKGADEQIAQAIHGFNTLDGKTIPKPDLLIVARGGGSLEDLMAFNEENVVRAVAQSTIPVISAVGHETDTTLIDYVADKRAPTPTGAAEMAVPVRIELLGYTQNMGERLLSASSRLINDRKNQLAAQTGKLTHPRQLLESKSQNIDILTEKLTSSLRRNIQFHQEKLQKTITHFVSPKYLVDQKRQNLGHLSDRLTKTLPRIKNEKHQQAQNIFRMLESLSHQGVLKRGYALVYDQNGNLVRNSQNIAENQELILEFAENDKIPVKTGKK
jgi:exodeoxyribonuclease VII large subunit